MNRRVSRIGDAVPNPYQVTLAAIVAFCLLMALAPAVGATTADASSGQAADASSGPTANATANSSTVGLVEVVTLNASGSTDSDDSIESYEWDVDGDGEVEATGATTNYSYDSPGTYSATVTVTDDSGNTDSATVTVTVNVEEDYLESNDGKIQAPDIGTGASYDNLTLHDRDDEDFFLVTPETDGTLSVSIYYDYRRLNGDTDFRIMEYDYDVLAAGYDDNDNAQASTEVEAGKLYLVEVRFDACETAAGPCGGAHWNDYDIDIDAPNSAPSADATANSSTVGVGETVTLDASGSSDADGSIESYEWDVDGDSETEATGATTEVSYDSIGTYDATVTVTDDGGATESAAVTVTVDDGLDANATASSSAVGAGETVTLDASNSTDAGGAIESYEWDVDGDGEVEATGATNDYSYDSPGTYDATVTVTDDDGYTDSATVTVTVDEGPAADAAASASTVTVGETVTLDASGSSDPDGAIESYEWDVDGDGETEATGATNDYSYDSAGRYDATVTVTDVDGTSDSATVTVAVEQPSNSAPTANATATVSTAVVGQTVWFDARNSTDPDGSIESYEWDVDGDGETEATGAVPEVSYDSPGTYNATVTVTDDGLATDTATVTVTVGTESGMFEPNDEMSSAADIDGGVDIDGLRISGGQDLDYYAVELDEGETVTSSIEFDHSDGNLDLHLTDEDEKFGRSGIPLEESESTTDDETVSYTADASGTYYVRVYSNNPGYGDPETGGGQANSYNLTISTSGGDFGAPANSAPTASVTPPPERFVDRGLLFGASGEVTAGQTLTFDASDSTDSDGSIESYEWDVDGDGEIEGTGAVFNHSYGSEYSGPASNSVDATVYVTDDDGATDSATVTVAINGWPIPTATANSSTVSVGETVTLNASGSVDPLNKINRYEWDVDDDGGTETTGSTPEVSYDSPGTYDATVTVYDGIRGTRSATVTITVEEASNSQPTANATADSSTLTVNETVTLDASGSTDADGSIESYEWDVDGDGEVEATGATNDYSYDSAGTYDATVTVTDDDGDTDDTTVTVTVEEDQGQSQPMSDAVDADDDGTIGDEEILNALHYWQDGEPVPGTGGESISDQEILDLIATWQQADSD